MDHDRRAGRRRLCDHSGSAEGIVGTGRALGLDEFLLIQWLAPFASEAPAVAVAVLSVLTAGAGNGLQSTSGRSWSACCRWR